MNDRCKVCGALNCGHDTDQLEWVAYVRGLRAGDRSGRYMRWVYRASIVALIAALVWK